MNQEATNMIRSGYKVMTAERKSAIMKLNLAMSYPANSWAYAKLGPLFVFVGEESACNFAWKVFGPFEYQKYPVLIEEIKYVPITPRQTMGLHDLRSTVSEMSLVTSYWKKTLQLKYLRLYQSLKLPAGTACAAAIWCGPCEPGPLDSERLNKIREQFGRQGDNDDEL